MCNDYGNHVPGDRYIEAFSQLRLPVFVEGNGPNLTPRDDIRIRDTAPVTVPTSDGAQLTEMTWAPRNRNKKPIFNFRSERRKFGISTKASRPERFIRQEPARP